MLLVARESTDACATDDPVVITALSYIRNHAARGVDVEDVATAAGVSRRVLEKHFRKALQRPPHQMIQHVRIERARRLLQETNLPAAQIARLSGFSGPTRFSAAFQQETGFPPAKYRRMMQQRPQR